MHVNDRLTLTIEKPVAGGRMLARHEGAIVLVAGALPGETVDVRVERVHRGTAFASTIRVVEPSADRVGESNSCGGCVFAHARYDAQLLLKQQIITDTFTRVARMTLEAPVPMRPSPATGYRMRARLHVEGSRLGFFREGTHELCDAGSTGQLLPATLEVLATLARGLSEVPGVVRTVELSESRDASARAVHLELSKNADPSRLGTVTRVEGLAGVSASHEGSVRSRVLWGTSRVSDAFAADWGTWVLERDARSFFQGNRYLLEALAIRIVEAVLAAPVLDLYAGVGLFSVALAAAGKDPVTAVEGDEVSAADLVQNSAPYAGRLVAHAQAVEGVLSRPGDVRDVRTVIVDPPRTGLSRQALAGLIGLAASRLVYVSCDVPTLARDARALVDAGYRMTAIEAFDMFPNTAHVETLVVFDRP